MFGLRQTTCPTANLAQEVAHQGDHAANPDHLQDLNQEAQQEEEWDHIQNLPEGQKVQDDPTVLVDPDPIQAAIHKLFYNS